MRFVVCAISRPRKHKWGDLNLQSSAAQHSRNVCRGAAVPTVRAISARLSKGLADLQRKAGFSRLSISRRLILLLLALALPLNLVTERVRSMKPDLKVLPTSGYSDLGVKVKKTARDVKILAKPYTRAQLACALREALDG